MQRFDALVAAVLAVALGLNAQRWPLLAICAASRAVLRFLLLLLLLLLLRLFLLHLRLLLMRVRLLLQMRVHAQQLLLHQLELLAAAVVSAARHQRRKARGRWQAHLVVLHRD